MSLISVACSSFFSVKGISYPCDVKHVQQDDGVGIGFGILQQALGEFHVFMGVEKAA